MMARPFQEGRKTEPPRDVAAGFAVHGDVVMEENAARGDDPTRKIQLANQGEKFSFETFFTGGPRAEFGQQLMKFIIR